MKKKDGTLKKCVVAGVLILSRDGRKVFLVKHKKLGVWIYPGGHLEENETPLECAIRETYEESGISFDIINTNDLRIRSEGANSLPMPLVIMDEIVPYAEAPHEHFDMIYLGVARSTEFRGNEESSDCGWFESRDVENIETYDNVKEIIRRGFLIYKKVNKSERKTNAQ